MSKMCNDTRPAFQGKDTLLFQFKNICLKPIPISCIKGMQHVQVSYSKHLQQYPHSLMYESRTIPVNAFWGSMCFENEMFYYS